MTNAGLGFGGELAEKLAQLNAGSKDSSDKMSINPELHWDRPAPQGDSANWNKTAETANEHVTGWLTNGGGGGIANSPVASPRQDGSGSHKNGNGGNLWPNSNQQSGNGAQFSNQWTNNNGNGIGDQNGNPWNGSVGGAQHGSPWNVNGNSWNNGNQGSNGNKNQTGNASSRNNNGGVNHPGGSLKGSGSGNDRHGYPSSRDNNGGGKQGGGSLNSGGQGGPPGDSWKGNNMSGHSWGGGSGVQKQSNWNGRGQGNTSWDAAGGGNSAGANAEADDEPHVEW